ncbi:hypothetical protein C8F04DRAFT_1401366 [Mycena alexandri]|uniref:Uncharacterized protein n=1 Tax=Mycena alexandri TaxID=1745969 RepID=A0AAD6SEM5_9AGAR|nr:hypothetical protein C8F04DRAFT_1401366 [Mycena alexandri]
MNFTLAFLSLLSVVSAAVMPTMNMIVPTTHRVVSVEEYMGRNMTNEHLDKRTPGNVFLCTDAGFQGTCVEITGAFDGGCVDLGFDLDNLVSSFGPDPGQTCIVYNAHGCADSGAGDPAFAYFISFPGVSDLSQPFIGSDGHQNAPFNDIISSYQCFFTTT